MLECIVPVGWSGNRLDWTFINVPVDDRRGRCEWLGGFSFVRIHSGSMAAPPQSI